VDALLGAAADILERHGYAKLTTNRIAARAGVNIASLYQFFPGKEAIVAELRRRHVAEQRGAMTRALEGLRGQGLEATVRALVAMGIAAHTIAPQLHRVLTEELPARASDASAQDESLFAEARRQLERVATGVPDRELALWMIDTVSHAAVHRAVVERPGDLASGRFADELVLLLVRYLRR
jgi:AcrR family transcriptional regulator